MYYDLQITTGCYKCGEIKQFPLPHNQDVDNTEFVCSICYDLYYSPQAIREKELNKLLFKWWHFQKWKVWNLPKKYLNYIGLNL